MRMMRLADYEVHLCDTTSPYHSGAGRHYIVTYRGRLIGHLAIHASGDREWSFPAGAGQPSLTTQARLRRSVGTGWESEP